MEYVQFATDRLPPEETIRSLLEEDIDELFRKVAEVPGYELEIDLPEQLIRLGDARALGFDIDPFRKDCLINGLDDIGLTLQHADDIRDYEEMRRIQAPWLFQAGSA